LKAAFMRQFAKFIEWPGDVADPSGPRVFCISDELVADAFEELGTDQRIGARSVVIRRVQAGADLQPCSMLFVGGSSRARITAFLAAAQGLPIFTIGDAPEFTTRGGMLHFYLQQSRMRFAINPARAQREGLKISSQMLRPATILRPAS
jgi:hypothetical protein